MAIFMAVFTPVTFAVLFMTSFSAFLISSTGLLMYVDSMKLTVQLIRSLSLKLTILLPLPLFASILSRLVQSSKFSSRFDPGILLGFVFIPMVVFYLTLSVFSYPHTHGKVFYSEDHPKHHGRISEYGTGALIFYLFFSFFFAVLLMFSYDLIYTSSLIISQPISLVALILLFLTIGLLLIKRVWPVYQNPDIYLIPAEEPYPKPSIKIQIFIVVTVLLSGLFPFIKDILKS